MIFDRLSILFRALITERDGSIREAIRRTVSRRARRWRAAFAASPDLGADLLAMGRVLAMAPRTSDDILSATVEELAYEAGRRDLALELLALMHVNRFEIHSMMQEQHHETDDDDDGRGPVA